MIKFPNLQPSATFGVNHFIVPAGTVIGVSRSGALSHTTINPSNPLARYWNGQSAVIYLSGTAHSLPIVHPLNSLGAGVLVCDLSFSGTISVYQDAQVDPADRKSVV